jgi:hypothetical protein
MTFPEIASFLILSWATGFGSSLILGYFTSKMRMIV